MRDSPHSPGVPELEISNAAEFFELFAANVAFEQKMVAFFAGTVLVMFTERFSLNKISFHQWCSGILFFDRTWIELDDTNSSRFPFVWGGRVLECTHSANFGRIIFEYGRPIDSVSKTAGLNISRVISSRRSVCQDSRADRSSVAKRKERYDLQQHRQSEFNYF